MSKLDRCLFKNEKTKQAKCEIVWNLSNYVVCVCHCVCVSLSPSLSIKIFTMLKLDGKLENHIRPTEANHTKEKNDSLSTSCSLHKMHELLEPSHFFLFFFFWCVWSKKKKKSVIGVQGPKNIGLFERQIKGALSRLPLPKK